MGPSRFRKAAFASKGEALADLLRRRIAGLPNGQRLPSVRALMKRYHLSMLPVVQALRALEREELIVTRRGSGCYVSHDRLGKSIILHRSRFTSISEDIRERDLRETIERAGWHFSVRYHDRSIDSHLPLVPEPAASAHLISTDLPHQRPDLLKELALQKVPVVLVDGRNPTKHPFDVLNFSWKPRVELVIRHLCALGHTRFGFLINEPHYDENWDKGFGDVIGELGLPAGVLIDCGTKPGESSRMMAYQGMRRFLRRREVPFTAMIVSSPAGGLGALRALHEAGIAVPVQCSVASVASLAENALSIPSLTEVRLLSEPWGQWTVDLLRERFAGSPPSERLMPVEPRLIVRESIGPCPPARSFSKKPPV